MPAKVLTIVACGFAIGVPIVVGLNLSDLSTLLLPSIVFGANAGFLVAAAAFVGVNAFPDRLELKNAFRYITIQRDDVYGLTIQSGIYIYLKDGHFVTSSAYTPTLGKRFGSNRRTRLFGEAIAAALNVPLVAEAPKDSTSLRMGGLRSRLRWETPAFMMVGALICVIIAIVARYA